MDTVVYISDKPWNITVDVALKRTLHDDIHVVDLDLTSILGDDNDPVEELKILLSKQQNVIAVAVDVPLAVIDKLMVSRFFLRLPLLTPVFRVDKFGWPQKRVIPRTGEKVLDVIRFEEITQFRVEHVEPKFVANLR